MNIGIAPVLHLLHRVAFGSLATQSLELPGYPFASLLPCAPDERHCPVFLLSALAEHTKNLLADPRASLLLHDVTAGNVLVAERVSLLGDVRRIEPSAALTARYLRYQPDAERYLALGDFAFFRMAPKTARYVGGFGRMGWVGSADWKDAMILDAADETALLHEVEGKSPAGIRIAGIDRYGLDVFRGDARERLTFPDGPLSTETIQTAIGTLPAGA